MQLEQQCTIVKPRKQGHSVLGFFKERTYFSISLNLVLSNIWTREKECNKKFVVAFIAEQCEVIEKSKYIFRPHSSSLPNSNFSGTHIHTTGPRSFRHIEPDSSSPHQSISNFTHFRFLPRAFSAHHISSGRSKSFI